MPVQQFATGPFCEAHMAVGHASGGPGAPWFLQLKMNRIDMYIYIYTMGGQPTTVKLAPGAMTPYDAEQQPGVVWIAH